MKGVSFLGFQKIFHSLLSQYVPSSQKNRLLRETHLKIQDKSIEVFTSRFGESLSNDTLSRHSSYKRVAEWARYKRISQKFVPYIYLSLKKKPRNPHKGWLEKLKIAFIEKVKQLWQH